MNPYTSDDPARTDPPYENRYTFSDAEFDEALDEIRMEKLRATRKHAGTDYVIEAITECAIAPRISMEIGELIADGLEQGDIDTAEIGRRLSGLVLAYLTDLFYAAADDRASVHAAAQAEDARDFWDEQGRAT